MTLLLLLVMVHGMVGNTHSESDRQNSQSNVHPSSKNPSSPPYPPPKSDASKINCCKKEVDNLRAVCVSNNKHSIMNIPSITNECPKMLQSETALKTYNRAEREFINRILENTNYSTDYNFGSITLTVVEKNLTKCFPPITDGKEDFQNNHEAKQKVEVAFYDSFHQCDVSKTAPTIQTLIPVEVFQNVSEAKQKVGIVIYSSSQQFNLRNVSIMSSVIRVEVFDRDIVNLTNPLIMHFPVNNYTNHSTKSYIYSCQYYVEQEYAGSNTWKTDGCNTTQISDGVVKCSCDHMTPFAVLLVEVNNIDGQQWEILSYISYVGCSLSAVFSASSILTFIFNRNARAEVSSSIHVSLSSALFLLNMSFMFSEWAATWTVKEVCVFTAVTIHYSLLCSFTWMAIEALHLYLLLARVFNIYIKYYMVKLSLIGWGVPAVLVGCLLSIQQLTHPFYGYKNVTLSNSNAASLVCWITEPLILYGVNLCYFTIVFLFNTIVLITVSRQIFKLKKVDNKHKKIPVKDASTVLGFMCLLGTSWGLVFLGSGYTSYPILYVFCISNTMQGFSIFLWMCRTTRPEKQNAAHTKSLSTVDTYTIEKQKE
ncbi:adhesion G-protein coupled receptor G5-like isoform X2 [Labeo rohita]|nr:adhesion G-protein coupled receptor G5-like isoform X2 [Labeo rohita]